LPKPWAQTREVQAGHFGVLDDRSFRSLDFLSPGGCRQCEEDEQQDKCSHVERD
jgi:hypothetical protein